MVTARIAGLRPGTSPPPVRIPSTPFFPFATGIFPLLDHDELWAVRRSMMRLTIGR